MLPDAVLNESTLATGKLAGGASRGVVKLDAPFELTEGRSYKLNIQRTVEGVARSESLNIDMPAGQYAAGTELKTQPRRSAKEIDGVSYTLVRSPRVPIRLIDVLIVLSAVAFMIGLELLVYRSKIGTAMRALSHSVETASLMGVNVNFVISFTFVLGTALAAAAAFLYPMKYPGLNQAADQIWVLLVRPNGLLGRAVREKV